MMRRLWIAALLGAAALTRLAPADGREAPPPEQVDAARALAEAGYHLYERGEFAAALDRFSKAEEIFHAAPHLLYIARSRARLGKLVGAQQAYEALVGEQLPKGVPKQFHVAQQEAKAELAELQPRVPALRIAVSGSEREGATVVLDGRTIGPEQLDAPVPVDPGEHVVEVRVDGREASRESVTVEEGAHVEVEVAPGPPVAVEAPPGAPTAPPADVDEPPSMVPPLIVGGLGIALVGVGAVTGVMTLNDAAELKDRCPQNPCPPDNESLGDEIVVLSTVSTVGFIAGGAAVAAGVLWLALQGGETEPAQQGAGRSAVRLLVGGPYLGVEGTF